MIANGESKVTKHIELRYHIVREMVENGKVKVERIPTDLNVADVFTKPLPRPVFEVFRDSINVC